MRSKCNIIWFLLAILLPYTSGQMYEDDACKMKSGASGVCKLPTKCPELETAVNSGKFSTRDIVNCGFTSTEEIICCPTGGQGVTTENSKGNDDFDSTTPRTTNPRVTPRTSTTISPFPTRSKDRAAVIACREIDEDLDPALTPHILGGTPVELGEFPHMAAIGFSDIGNDQGPYDYRCGGTLIAKRFVLTAAHCVNSRESRPAVVLLGLVNLKDENELRDAQQIPVRTPHIHKDYSSSRTYHDIAILELEREVEYSNLIYPTCLYTELEDPPKALPLYVTGWGTINTATRETSLRLLKAKLDVVSVNQCNASFVQMGLNRRIVDGVTNTQLCAHDPGYKKDACQGDSGGPLNIVIDESLKKYRIVGVVSAGFSCGSATPGLYTRVASYLDFIESIVWPHLA